ncbi:hypothetical protein [Kitasatospora sp. NPDC047058]|uniref:hypothetical protein n=1 Tax=Kitasatospora sp. NPDC047058 TaxID=3155620 RepID=UPI0033CC5D2B
MNINAAIQITHLVLIALQTGWFIRRLWIGVMVNRAQGAQIPSRRRKASRYPAIKSKKITVVVEVSGSDLSQ